ncbi:MAG TPA: thiamine diphosphokinase [Clostridium sp.]|nr:thiamine diphosphokinase [Clostridium sp.]
MNALIVSGGNAPSEKLLRKYAAMCDFIIGADKGNECLIKYNIIPQLSLGDFDSINKETFETISSKNIEIKKFPPEKDYTDTEIAIMEALKMGAEKIYLLGATGTRVDHTLGNIGLILTTKDKGAKLVIADDNNIVYLADNNMTLYGEYGENISFHALSDVVKNFKIQGAKYNLDGYDMHLLDPRAICNEFIDTPIKISFESGNLLIMHSND